MSGPANHYPLRRMLTVRALREDQALRDLRQKMAEVEAAAETLEARIRDEAASRASLRGSHGAFFAATLGKTVASTETAPLRRTIDAWKMRVAEAEAAVQEARKALDAAKEACEASRLGYQARMKDTHKIASHKYAWMTEALKAVEAAADAEMEEVRTKAPRAKAETAENDQNDGADACRR